MCKAKKDKRLNPKIYTSKCFAPILKLGKLKGGNLPKK